jgi:glyoxylase-like metal-dependent hydrolase (beta-lactamase superfamily II)
MGRFKQILVLLTFFSMVSTSFAQDDSDSKEKLQGLIDAVATAYGGSALMEISNYRITERYISPATGQSWTPDLVNIGQVNQEFVHDLESGNVYFENWFIGRGGLFPTITIVNGEDAWSVNIQTNRYGDAASADPYTIAGGTMRTTDTLLVRELLKSQADAEYLGTAVFMNRPHEMVKIPFPQSPELTLYFDSESHLLSRMTRDNPQLGLLDYVFQDHYSRNGITRAARTNFFVAGDANLIGARREIRFNDSLPASTFTRPGDLEREGDRMDTSEITVNRLASNVYHIGQGAAYSIFVDTGSEIIGCGGYAGLNQRLAKFREESGSHRPLRFQVVTHHHQDHLGGINEALELGATLVTVSGNIETISEGLDEVPESGRFLTVNQRMTLGSGDGRVELYDVSTIHSVSNLVFHVPSSKTLFLADHFGSPYEKGTPVANRNTVSMSEALEPLDLNYSRIVTAHGARVFSARDFGNSVKAYRDYDCPDDRPLCAI